MNVKFRIFLIVLLIATSVNLVQASWVPESDFKDGIIGGVGWPSPVIGYNVTGDDNWTLIYADMFGNNYGFYWNGAVWIPDQNRVSGITDHDSMFVYSSTSLGYNVTGNDNWELIYGFGSGQFKGYYWNGTSWVEDSDIVSGLADVGNRATPTLAYNVTGNDNWILLTGEWKLEGDTEIVGYQFENNSWEVYNEITTGLPNVEHITKPHFAYNLTGDGNWNLIICDDSGVVSGHYWSGTSWISDSSIISGLSSIGSFANIVTNYDIRNDEEWTLISGNADNEFFAYYYNSNPITSSLQTESQVNPTGILINASNPYFSWEYFDLDEEIQYSYEIKVGTSEGISDMWNSEEVISSDSFANYDGITLEEVTTYYVQIRTSDSIDNSAWILGTFMLRDTTVYSSGLSEGGSGTDEVISVVIKEEKITEIPPETFIEMVINILPETDSMMFFVYFAGALLGALIFAIAMSKENVLDVIFGSAVGWVLTLLFIFINNLYSLIDTDTVLLTIISVVSGFVVYAIYDHFQYLKK